MAALAEWKCSQRLAHPPECSTHKPGARTLEQLLSFRRCARRDARSVSGVGRDPLARASRRASGWLSLATTAPVIESQIATRARADQLRPSAPSLVHPADTGRARRRQVATWMMLKPRIATNADTSATTPPEYNSAPARLALSKASSVVILTSPRIGIPVVSNTSLPR